MVMEVAYRIWVFTLSTWWISGRITTTKNWQCVWTQTWKAATISIRIWTVFKCRPVKGFRNFRCRQTFTPYPAWRICKTLEKGTWCLLLQIFTSIAVVSRFETIKTFWWFIKHLVVEEALTKQSAEMFCSLVFFLHHHRSSSTHFV